jgi:hypothetical protein
VHGVLESRSPAKICSWDTPAVWQFCHLTLKFHIMKHKCYLKEARLTKAGGAYFYVSTSAGTDVVSATDAEGIISYTRKQDRTPRKWGYLSLCSASGAQLTLDSPAVAKLLSRCTPTEVFDNYHNGVVTKYLGDNTEMVGYRLDDQAPITKAGVDTGGFWASAHQELSAVPVTEFARLLKLCEKHKVKTTAKTVGGLQKALTAAGISY